MRQTLTTETLNLWRNNAEITAGETADDDPEHIAAKAILALTAELLANREAQPVGYIDPDSLKEYRGQRAGGTWSAVQRTTSGLNMTTPIYTVPPAPAVPGIDELRLTFERSERESDDGFNLHKYGIGYADEATQARWESWLSCRAAMLDNEK
ncbi:hypothetical protein ACUNI2_24620 [Serratia sp. IR-2025]